MLTYADVCSGESESILRGVFARARALQPCLLFLDEIDAIVARRSLSGAYNIYIYIYIYIYMYIYIYTYTYIYIYDYFYIY